MDRQNYWAARSQSRVESTNRNPTQITAILDSMDAAKHAWPRSKNLLSKEFASFVRPRLTSTSLIIHGHSVTLALSPSTCSSNSSRTSELLAHGLTRLSKQVNLTGATFTLQGDNCSKECKNNGQLRLLGAWVGLGKLKAAECSFLSSGHSHEDVDAMFGHIRHWLESHSELLTPDAFQSCLTNFFADTSRRQHERDRSVVMMTKFHDWSLTVFFVYIVFCFNIVIQTPFKFKRDFRRSLQRPFQGKTTTRNTSISCASEESEDRVLLISFEWSDWGIQELDMFIVSNRLKQLRFHLICFILYDLISKHVSYIYIFIPSPGVAPEGLRRQDLDSTFWDRRLVPHSDNDVILRTATLQLLS